jgi:hypothetical protein
MMPGFAAPPPLVNKVNEDPYLKENIDWIRERRSGNNVAAQKQRAFGDIDDLAAANSRGLDSMMARRGIGGSGISIESQKENMDAAARAKVRAGIDIDSAEQQRQDALALQAADIMRAPSAYNLGQQGLNLAQWQAQAGQNNFLSQFAAQQQQNQLGNYMDLFRLFGGQQEQPVPAPWGSLPTPGRVGFGRSF